MKFQEAIKETVLTHQPLRIMAKSVRNLFFPTSPEIELRRTITIEVSSVCDAKCIFCNYRLGYREKKIASLEWFASIARSSIAQGYKHLDLTSMGGEILTHKNVIEVFRIAKEVGFDTVSTFTNGIQLYRFDIEGLLTSGVDYLFISTPGFSDQLYESLFGVRKFSEFQESIRLLLDVHKKINSHVQIFFEPRTFLTKKELEQSMFYSTVIGRYIGEHVHLSEPLRVFDTWGGDITQRDMVGNMKVDWNPVKSIYPLRKVYPCERLYMVSVLANGDVRLCNCRYDSSIETERDSLYIDSLSKYEHLEALMTHNSDKIKKIRKDFVHGKLPQLCEKCPFYVPVEYIEG